MSVVICRSARVLFCWGLTLTVVMGMIWPYALSFSRLPGFVPIQEAGTQESVDIFKA
jgi:hypothetical protein